MRTIQEFSFFKETTAAATSNTLYINQYSESATIQVSGSFNSCSLTIQAKTDDNADWVDMTVINIGKLETADSITTPGIYTVDVSGVKQMRAVLSSVSGGEITVYALCKGGE